MKEKKARIEDALHAVRAALEEGIVPGGGVALIRSLKAVAKLEAEGDEKTGIEVVRQALTAPLRQIAENAGLEGGVVLAKVMNGKGASFGYNAETGNYGDLVKDGVIDPAKVVRTALQNGSSVARILLTTDCCVAEKPKKKGEGAGPGGPGMEDEMGGMGGMGGMM
jgi:chaperonin GroEL